MYFMSDPQALHVTRNVIPGKLGVDLHLHRVHIPLVLVMMVYWDYWPYKLEGHLQSACLCEGSRYVSLNQCEGL